MELLLNVQFKSGSNPIGVVQRAGFEPANRYGLGPHPSAFDQAGQPLRNIPPTLHPYFNTARGHGKKTEQQVRLASAAEI